MADVPGGFRFQISNITEFLRYRQFFETIRFDIGIGSAPKVLIVGCSTGEELRTVYHFWPEATVSACDVQEDMLVETRRRFPNADVFPSVPAEIERRPLFDLICANSVFCRNPLPDGPVAEILPFSMVDEYVSMLTSRLAEKAILMLYNTNYFVQDMSSYEHLTGITSSRSWTGAFVPRLTPTGEVCADPVLLDNEIARYVIRPDRAPADITHLSCALFRKGRRGGNAVLNVNSGAQPISCRPVLTGPIRFPEIADFSTVYMPYFRTVRCSVEGMCHSSTETYVTDFVHGGWTLHGVTSEVVVARTG
jgi:SAM-dependent methyltransferase